MPHRPPFHVLLLRHGQTDANATGVLQGHQPTPLNALGLLQAQRLAGRVARHAPKVTALVSSDLRRAAQTVEPVSAACGLAASYDRAWRERGFGEFEGRLVGERETWRAAHGDADPPGAESLADFRARVRRALESLPDQFPDHRCVAVVTHGGPVGVILRMLSAGELPLAPGAAPPAVPQVPNCSVLELVREQTDGGFAWRAACVNDVAHLSDLVTEADAG
jgi:probable phosphoglycerate mutase